MLNPSAPTRSVRSKPPRIPGRFISILPGAETVEEVVLGRNGTFEGMRPGTVHLEMSTIDVERKAMLRDAVVAAGGEMLDAPISGGPMMVAPGLCTTFVSGEIAAVERARPVLQAISGPLDSSVNEEVERLRHSATMGAHRCVRHRGADEVHRQHAARCESGGRCRGVRPGS